jgi:hypothetical protein
MKTCKDLNIELCNWCSGKYADRCFINDWSSHLTKLSYNEVKDFIMMRIRFQINEDNIYMFATIRNYLPQYIDFLDKILILK